jgi:hypothetical protein
LRRRKREQAEDLLKLGVRQTEATLVCARRDGEPLQPQSLTHEFPRFLARLGREFPRVRFHDLRHSQATQLLLAGVHPKVAQERLGHSTISTTLDLYSHVSATMQEDAAARIDAAFRHANPSSRIGAIFGVASTTNQRLRAKGLHYKSARRGVLGGNIGRRLHVDGMLAEKCGSEKGVGLHHSRFQRFPDNASR